MKTHIPASSPPLHGDEELCSIERPVDGRRTNEGGSYPLYDVPYLVRDPNEYRMSAKRHAIELRNQAVVDDYFLSRANGATAHDAQKVVASKHGITAKRMHYIFVCFYREAKKRGKYDFCEKFFSPDGTLK